MAGKHGPRSRNKPVRLRPHAPFVIDEENRREGIVRHGAHKGLDSPSRADALEIRHDQILDVASPKQPRDDALD